MLTLLDHTMYIMVIHEVGILLKEMIGEDMRGGLQG